MPPNASIIAAKEYLFTGFLKILAQHGPVRRPEAQHGNGVLAEGFGIAQQRGRADAAPHQEVPALPVHPEAPAQGTQHVQPVPRLPAGEPLGALPPHLKDDAEQILLPVADGDGAAEQAAVAALHMDKLVRPLGRHALRLQGEGIGKRIEAHRLHHGTVFLNRHGSNPPLSFCWPAYPKETNRQISSRMAMAAFRAASW